MSAAPLRLLHCHSTFSLGGKEARAVRLMNAFGDAAEHVVLSAMPDRLEARARLDPEVRVQFPADAPTLTGSPTPARLQRLSRYMRAFDLVLTYNWGAFDAVMAARIFGGAPLIHHEDGFNADEAKALKTRRNLYRRIGFGGALRLVVPSRGLEAIARRAWGLTPARIVRIPNGIPVAGFAHPPRPGVVPGLERRPGEILVGTVAGLRAVKNLPLLVRAVARMQRPARLVIVGEGPERDRILAEAQASGLGDRLVMAGFLDRPQDWLGHFDIFALSSDSEQFPLSMVEAMAAGLPVVATRVGDIPVIAAAENRPFLVDSGDEAGFADRLDRLADQPDLRRAIGTANQRLAQAEHDEKDMIAAYARLYGEAAGRPRALSGAT